MTHVYSINYIIYKHFMSQYRAHNMVFVKIFIIGSEMIKVYTYVAILKTRFVHYNLF